MAHFNQNSGGPGVPGSQRLNRLWIGGLPRNVAIDDVRAEVNRIYASFGPVADVCVITTARDVMCFVQYEDEQVAFRAREDTNGSTVLGSVIKVNYAVIRGPDAPRGAPRPGMPQTTSPAREKERDPNRSTVFLADLPFDITEAELHSVAKGISEHISFVNVWKVEKEAFGLIRFFSSRDAKRASIKLNGATVDGSKRPIQSLSFDEFNERARKSHRSRSTSRERRRR